MKVEFQSMTLRELKAYVLECRHNQVAFQALADRVAAQPKGQVYGDVDAKQFSKLLKQRYHLKSEP
ncbi:MAG: hypothetical protein ACFCU8_01290 [Thermosynechococcaceae cyanobacterium]